MQAPAKRVCWENDFMTEQNEFTERIEGLIGSSDVFLFMKGSPMAPRCGFSANVVGILNHLGISFESFDILTDPGIRKEVKNFSNWPTYPQLYARGQFVGGNDIVSELMESGELEGILQKN